MRGVRFASTLLPVAFIAACAEEPAHVADAAGPGGGAGGGAFPCPPGGAQTEAGCEPAGIAPERCGGGFEPDEANGCEPILPAERCPEGQMAVPGEAACREIAPCGPAPWGDAPLDDTTQFVDAAYAGGDG